VTELEPEVRAQLERILRLPPQPDARLTRAEAAVMGMVGAHRARQRRAERAARSA